MATVYGAFRTRLTEAEKKRLKEMARAKGMTLTGLHDAVIREALESQNRHSVSES